MTSPPILFEQSDFDSPDETVREYHHRLHPLPARSHALRFCAIGTLGAVAFLATLWVAYFGALIA